MNNLSLKRQVGKIYLLHKEYQLSLPFLPLLQSFYINDKHLQTEIGNAFYWKKNFYPEAFTAYQTALNEYERQKDLDPFSKKQKALICHQIGTIYLIKATNDQNYKKKAVEFLTLAVKTDPKNEIYQKSLNQFFIDQWEAAPKDFPRLFGGEWLKILNLLNTNILNTSDQKIIPMMLDCCEHLFNSVQNHDAHDVIKQALQIYPTHVELKIKVLDLAARFNNVKALLPCFDQWAKDNCANPYLQMKIGDAYSQVDKKLAVQIYQQALVLFTQKLSGPCQVIERAAIQNHMADIHSKLGQLLLTSGNLFYATPYEKTIEHFKSASDLNPSLYSSPYFDACLEAANKEKNKYFLTKDINKIINYYQQCYKAMLQNGNLLNKSLFLNDLLQIYLDSQQLDEATKLYIDLKKQPWFKQLVIPSAILTKIAEKLNNEEAVECYKIAFEQEPTNKIYKENYFKTTFLTIQIKYGILQKDKNQLQEQTYINSLLALLTPLEDCWKIGFNNCSFFELSYKELFAKIYSILADCYVERCLLPMPKNEYHGKPKIHFDNHKDDINKALNYFDKAILFQPEDGKLHFNKGLLLDRIMEYEKAIKEYELAIQYQPGNPFYLRLVGMTKSIITDDHNENEKSRELALQKASDDFENDFSIWFDEYMSKVKTKNIDPHSQIYQKTKSWFLR